ncbi:MAG: type I-B CRISPR-associated protein Cas7/Cst2/DevR [Clostridiaceae bacterium]|jgi:CRISPR-associated protein Cst2|nr:type I-B CRISPR-associated protein Cas7/Cst2/DevR [Clostridiaceae bacterium]
MKKNGLTISVVFEAQSANFGEGMGNISSLKQLSRGDGNSYTYISRQALRYSIVKQLAWDQGDNKKLLFAQGSGEKTVIQFSPEATISEYPEIDLFGYMKTRKGKTGGAETRNAVARLSHAISLESYKADTDFLTNKGLADRIGSANSIAQSENHKSYYAYTLTIDLDRIGVERDKSGKITEEIPNAEKAKRVGDLLNVIKLLYRDIRGRRENLSPIFVIGGVYETKNPYFADRIKLYKGKLDISKIIGAMTVDEDSEKNTAVGYLSGAFANDADIYDKLKPVSVREFFDGLKKEVGDYYA